MDKQIDRRDFIRSLGGLLIPAYLGGYPKLIAQTNPLNSRRDKANAMTASLAAGLVAYWKLDEIQASGTRVDSVDSHNLADTHANVVGTSGGLINGCASTFGVAGGGATASFLEVADNSDLGIGAGKSFTCSGWVFAGVSGIVQNSVFWCKWSASTNDYVMRTLPAGSNTQQVNFCTQVVAGGTFPCITSSHLIVASSWNHVVGGYDDGLQQCWMQINGNARESTSCAGVIRTAAPFAVGNYADNATDNNLSNSTAAMDEIGFWVRSLSSAEVITLNNGGHGLRPPGV